MTNKFSVKTPVFEGPLDLLLSLIEKHKLFINDISLSKVADDFINYIQNYENIPMGESAQFILIASTLILIKSKSLLPTLSLTEDEEKDIHDLEIRLKIYKRIKEASIGIDNLFGKNTIYFQSQQRPIEIVFSPHESMNLISLVKTIKDLLNSLPKKEQIPKAIIKKVISLEETINSLSKRVSQGLRLKFSEFSGMNKEEKVNVIVSFLAMLELVKQGAINVFQDQNCGDIHMESKEIGVPRYN